MLGQAGLAGLAMATTPAWAQTMVDLPLPGGPGARAIATNFPQKGAMILQRTRPPLLESPFEVFDQGGVGLIPAGQLSHKKQISALPGGRGSVTD